jgi:hypothetical protein
MPYDEGVAERLRKAVCRPIDLADIEHLKRLKNS